MESENRYIRNDDNDEEKDKDIDVEWDGFKDTISAPVFDTAPPRIQSCDSRELALQSVQIWARDHGHALRFRDISRNHDQISEVVEPLREQAQFNV